MNIFCCDNCSAIIGIGDEAWQNANTVTLCSSDATGGSVAAHRSYMLCDRCYKDVYDDMQHTYEYNVNSLKARFDK